MRKKYGKLGDANEAQLKKASMALDDFVWVLQKLDLKQVSAASDFLRSALAGAPQSSSVAKTYKSGNENKDFLIGVLPRLFQDKELFPTNEDISEFASSALGLVMPRADKRSRYEMIGKIVVEMSNMSDGNFSSIADALELLIDDKEKIAGIRENKKAGTFSWNETLQSLLRY